MTVLAVILGTFGGLFVWLTFNWLLSLGNKLKRRPKIYVYAQPGFWYPLKYIAFRVILFLRRRQNKQRQENSQASSQNAGYGIKSRNSPEEMDKLQQLPPHEPQAVDAVYINGGNEEGMFFVAATARRQDNVVQTILYLRLPKIGLLELPSLPDTWLQDKNGDKAFSAGGLTLSPVTPMYEWSISFDGEMRIAHTDDKVSVKFDLKWKAHTKYFDFDTDMHPHVMADAIARERWSSEFFETLKRCHQTHYEQFGEITGTVHVDGMEAQDVKLQGVRDHSYGNIRDWKDFHRYALNYAYLEDGTALCVGAICMPKALSTIVVGYIFLPNGTMHPVSFTDFEFHNWGDDGNPPDKMKLTFNAGREKYVVECEVIESPIFYMGEDWDAKIHERFCRYTVNGVKGWGISEWEYRHYGGSERERHMDQKETN